MKILNVLVVEDDVVMLSLITEILKSDGYNVVSFSNSAGAVEYIKGNSYDILFTDLRMHNFSGFDILKISKEKKQDIPVIIITAHGTVELAVEAIKSGAYDFIQKPFEPEQLLMLARRAAEYITLINKNIKLQKELEYLKEVGFIGEDNRIVEIRDIIGKIAAVDVPILITGETGTGKELVARLIYHNSNRSSKTFVPINCGAFSESLLESELFGHEKGSFTGAISTRKGIFESTNCGTIFLDEINSSTLNFQTKLLRVIEDQKIIRVGSSQEIDVDVRLIFATNSNLEEEIKKGNFRKDLYYRISMIKIDIPPLREREGDIVLLANYFLSKKSNKYGKDFKNISQETLERMLAYNWPGNVRELESCIEKAVILGNPPTIDALNIGFNVNNVKQADDICCKPISKNIFETSETMTLENVERVMILKALQSTNFNKSKAANILGINPSTLYRKLKDLNIESQ